MYLFFVDYTEAFDKIVHNEMIHLLDDINVDDKDLRIIQCLYYQQTASIRVRDSFSRNFLIKKGVCQGCVLSPDLFSLYSEVVMRSIEGLPGIVIRGITVSDLRYADDTV